MHSCPRSSSELRNNDVPLVASHDCFDVVDLVTGSDGKVRRDSTERLILSLRHSNPLDAISVGALAEDVEHFRGVEFLAVVFGALFYPLIHFAEETLILPSSSSANVDF
ncbi:MAG: hypothetical protein V7645_2804 [Actinomycetota bacterium]